MYLLLNLTRWALKQLATVCSDAVCVSDKVLIPPVANTYLLCTSWRSVLCHCGIYNEEEGGEAGRGDRGGMRREDGASKESRDGAAARVQAGGQ